MYKSQPTFTLENLILEEALGDVQVKFHQAKYAPTQMEWLKFLSGCFARRVDSAVFITTGQLTAEQRREAREANVIVIEGQNEVSRLAALYKIERFELFDEHTA